MALPEGGPAAIFQRHLIVASDRHVGQDATGKGAQPLLLLLLPHALLLGKLFARSGCVYEYTWHHSSYVFVGCSCLVAPLWKWFVWLSETARG